MILAEPLSVDVSIGKKPSKLPGDGHSAQREGTGSDLQCQVSNPLCPINGNDIVSVQVQEESCRNPGEAPNQSEEFTARLFKCRVISCV